MEENIVFKQIAEKDVNMLPPLVLAYVGDSIYEIYIRRYLIGENKDQKVNVLHKKAIRYVKAKAQATAALELKKILTDEEWGVIRRGRNVKSNTVPKNADITDYKYATGFEALMGYLYMKNRVERMEELIAKSIKIIESQN